MTAQVRYPLPAMPAALAGLAELALDLRWSWSHSSDVLWKRLDPELWETTANPWHILQTVAQTRLQEAADDPEFVALLEHHLRDRSRALKAPSWFEKTFPAPSITSIAYFSMEYGLGEALPIYSGGLGILAGDFLKAASDMGVPVIGVGLLWAQGYFRQALSTTGEQLEFFPFNDPGQLPIEPLRDSTGEWLTVALAFPRREVQLRVWQVTAGRTKLFLLDSNHLLNSPADRGITSELYGGGQEARLQQEIILGIGGWQVLRALGLDPEVCHLNEGHAALAVLERARCYAQDHGLTFHEALRATRPGNLFTTHTPVEAGFDRFPPDLIRRYLNDYAGQAGLDMDALLAMGRVHRRREATSPDDLTTTVEASDPFYMAHLAISGSGTVNAVSRLHGEVSRRLFQPLFPRWPQAEVPVGHVTNGVHVPSWDSDSADALWTEACGKDRWLGDVQHLADSIRGVTDEDLWSFRNENRARFIEVAREHVGRQGPVAGSLETLGDDPSCLCDPGVLTLGFARRFATYKRPNLLLHDPDRLERLLCGDGSRVQLVLSGKAHPADAAGKAMIKEWTDFIARCKVRPHVIFLVDYDMGLAEHLVHGVDVWLNTPRRPWEASGTSGMKVLVNGGLNLSELDGWWAEAYSPSVGWSLGDGLEHGEDPHWDAVEAEELYDLLENQVIPEFYDRDASGLPRRWIARIRESMAVLTPQFSTNRMMREYLEQCYLPAAALYRDRRLPGRVREIEEWQDSLEKGWEGLAFEEYSITNDNGPQGAEHTVVVRLALGEVPAEAVRVELYADALADGAPERVELLPETSEPGGTATNRTIGFRAVFSTDRPRTDYTPRVVPRHDGVLIPLECDRILWYR